MEAEDEGQRESSTLQDVIAAIKLLKWAGICAINVQTHLKSGSGRVTRLVVHDAAQLINGCRSLGGI